MSNMSIAPFLKFGMSKEHTQERNYHPDQLARNASKKLLQIIGHGQNRPLSANDKKVLSELQNPASKNLSEEFIRKYVTELNVSQNEGGLYGTVCQMIDDPDHSIRQSAYIILRHSVSREASLRALISCGIISLLLKSLPDETLDNKVIILKTLSFCCPTAESDIITLGGMEGAHLLLESPCPAVRAMSAEFVSKLVSSVSGAGRAFDCGVAHVLLNLLCDQHAHVRLNSLKAISRIAQVLPEKLLYETDETLPDIFKFLNEDDMTAIRYSLELLLALCSTAQGRHLVNKHKYKILRFTKSREDDIKSLAWQIMKYIPYPYLSQ